MSSKGARPMSRFWQNFVSNGRPEPSPTYLGIQGYAVRLDPAASERDRTQDGVLVRMVQPGSLAENAGILEGDIVLAIDEHPVGTADELFGIVEVLPPQAPVSVVLMRNGRRFERLLVTPPRRRPR